MLSLVTGFPDAQDKNISNRQLTPTVLLLTQFLPYFITNYPLNLGLAAFFRKYGFLASLAMRLGFYAIWHILYGSIIYPRLV